MLRNLSLHSDRLGIITSVGCAIHCTILPLLVSGLSFLDVEFLENEMLEWGMIALAFIFGMVSFWNGFFRHHRKIIPVTLFATGFSCLLLNKVFSEKWVFIFIPLSALLIISGHVLNIYLVRRTGKCAC